MPPPAQGAPNTGTSMTVLKPLQLVKPQTCRGTGVDEVDEARAPWLFYGFLWSSMVPIATPNCFEAWRTCEMDRILCHKAAALTDALELGACLKRSLALRIFRYVWYIQL